MSLMSALISPSINTVEGFNFTVLGNTVGLQWYMLQYTGNPPLSCISSDVRESGMSFFEFQQQLISLWFICIWCFFLEVYSSFIFEILEIFLNLHLRRLRVDFSWILRLTSLFEFSDWALRDFWDLEFDVLIPNFLF